MQAGFLYDVFVSYRHEEPDQSWARGVLTPALKAEGFKVCLDVECFTLGAFVLGEMERAVRESRYTLAVLTPAYLESGFAELEELMAEQLGLEGKSRRRIVLMREPCDPGLRIRTRLWLDMSDDSGFTEQMARLTQALRQDLGSPRGA